MSDREERSHNITTKVHQQQSISYRESTVIAQKQKHARICSIKILLMLGDRHIILLRPIWMQIPSHHVSVKYM